MWRRLNPDSPWPVCRGWRLQRPPSQEDRAALLEREAADRGEGTSLTPGSGNTRDGSQAQLGVQCPPPPSRAEVDSSPDADVMLTTWNLTKNCKQC